MDSSPNSKLDMAGFALTLITTRQNILPKWLTAPGPTDEQIHAMFSCAAAAPDHGELMPWRFVIVPLERRHLLADCFAQALLERDGSATAEQIEQARQKAFRAPFLALAVARLDCSQPLIEPLEQMVSVGAAIQNILLYAHSTGLGCSLTGGQAMRSKALRQLFGLSDGEQAVCCINVGSVTKRKSARLHPPLGRFVSSLA